MKWGAVVGPAAVTALLACAPGAGAATITVLNNNDSGPGSLRAAIASANPGDTIVVGTDTYTLTSGPLTITKSLTIKGAGAPNTVISGNHASQVLVFTGAGNVTVSGVTVANGLDRAPGGTADGGGISSDAGTNLTLSQDAVTNNVADAGSNGTTGSGIAQGAGIYTAGNLTVTDSVVSGNHSRSVGAGSHGGSIAQGGGIFDNAAPSHSLMLTNVTLDSNTADASGGSGGATAGIAEGGSLENNNSSAPMTLLRVSISRSSTVSDASLSASAGIAGGGGLQARSPATLTNVTISQNSSDASASGTGSGDSALGGGLLASAAVNLLNNTITNNGVTATGAAPGSPHGGDLALGAGGSITAGNSIVAAGSGSSGSSGTENCSGTITSHGHNIDSLDQCHFHSTADQINTNPKLGPLQINGGAEPTEALLLGSPAINAGDSGACPATDEREVARPQGSACDIGAYEFAPPTVTTDPASNVSQTRANLTGKINPNTRDASYHFEYGTTTSYGLSTGSGDAGAANSAGGVSTGVGGLRPNTTYHFALVATNGDGTSVSQDRTFTTLPKPALSGLRVKPRRFATRRSRRHHKVGTKFSFQLNTAATVTFKLQAARRGRSGTRWVTLKGQLTINGHGGANTFHFNGRLHGKRLKPGRYRLIATPRAGGTAGTGKRASFRVVS